MKADHPDSKYAYIYFTYLKEFAIKFRDYTTFAFMDDKATVPVGEPNNAISTNVRSHNKSLGSTRQPIGALDHDWKLGGLVPSVSLICDIPESTKETFFSGTPYVTTKEKVFEPSDCYRHSIELINILRSHYSVGNITNDKEILLLFSDGGENHNVTHISTQISLICPFLQVDVDMLIALQCCTSQSWMNPAERVISLLNLACQNCALERDAVPVELESKLRKVSSMNQLRILSKRIKNLQEEFNKSMESVKAVVNS